MSVPKLSIGLYKRRELECGQNVGTEENFSPISEVKPYAIGFEKHGTRGRTRTGTLLRAGDFESPVSTNFTTLALLEIFSFSVRTARKPDLHWSSLRSGRYS